MSSKEITRSGFAVISGYGDEAAIRAFREAMFDADVEKSLAASLGAKDLQIVPAQITFSLPRNDSTSRAKTVPAASAKKTAGGVTDADRESLKYIPGGWFEATALPHQVRAPAFRCERLQNFGYLESRVTGSYPDLRREYHRTNKSL